MYSENGSEIVFVKVIFTDESGRLCSKPGIKRNHEATWTYSSLYIIIENKVTQVSRVDECLNIN